MNRILRFRHVLEKHKLAEQILQTINELLLTAKGLLLKSGTVVDATLIAAPSADRLPENGAEGGQARLRAPCPDCLPSICPRLNGAAQPAALSAELL